MTLKHMDEAWNKYVDVKMSRDRAKKLWEYAKSVNGKAFVDQKMLTGIKQYSSDVFGSSAYWPWLACYAEMRREFVNGWIPDDYYRFELLPKINPDKFIRFSEAKTIDYRLFNNLVVAPIFFRTGDQYFKKNGDQKTRSEVEHVLSKLNQEIIIKPDDGRGGKSILFKHSSEINLDDLPKGNLLFQKVVQQHAELNKLYPHSINTFRVMTYLNQSGEIEIKFMIIRFGLGGARIDNASAGGGWIFIHKDGTPSPMGYDKWGFPMGSKHPDTGMIYSDLDIPFLPKIITLCEKAHRKFPYTRIIGWDVFINQKGEAKLIEWNANNPFWEAIEAQFGPFLKELLPSNNE